MKATRLALFACGCLLAAVIFGADDNSAPRRVLVPSPPEQGQLPPVDGAPPPPPAPPVGAALPPAQPAGADAAAASAIPEIPASHGEVPVLDGQEAVPARYQEDRYAATFAKNPFLVKTVAAPVATASFSEDWDLGSVVERQGSVKIGLRSKKEPGKWKYVTAEPDAEGFRLVSADIQKDRRKSSAKVAKGSEEANFTFGETGAPGGAPGAVAGRPGGMGGSIIPGQPPGAMNRAGAVPTPIRPTMPGAVPAGAAGMTRPNLPGQQSTVPGGMPGVNHSMVPNAVPAPGNQSTSPSARRRVLIPAPVQPTQPVP